MVRTGGTGPRRPVPAPVPGLRTGPDRWNWWARVGTNQIMIWFDLDGVLEVVDLIWFDSERWVIRFDLVLANQESNQIKSDRSMTWSWTGPNPWIRGPTSKSSYLEILVSPGLDFSTDGKRRVRAFQPSNFRPISSSPAREMDNSKKFHQSDLGFDFRVWYWVEDSILGIRIWFKI